ncbi:MAG: hypothetical protein AB7S26_31650 [Sandaracinaceae bacterium]
MQERSIRWLSVLRWLGVATALASCNACGGSRPPVEAQPLAEAPPPELPARPRGAVRTWSPLGTNLDGPADWSQAIPFIDQFRLSRAWTSSRGHGQPDDERAIDVDAHGWVRSLQTDQIVRTGLIWDVPHARAGDYVVLYEGRGRIELFTLPEERVTSRGDGRLVVDYDPARDGAAFGIAITEVDASDPIRSIRVIEPGGACERDHARFCDDAHACDGNDRCLDFEHHHEELVFDPDFLETVRSYRTLRFMNWQSTNDSTERTWDDRPRMDDARWSVHGIPPEVMIDLANRVGAEPWLSIPHMADDGYARGLGALVARTLDDGIPVHVELSNEIWNTIFAQHDFAIAEGHRLRVPRHDEDDTFAQLHWQARRSVQVWDAFDDGFGAGANERVRHVLAAHAANVWIAQQMLDFEGTGSHVDELAIAPYFGTFIGPDNREASLRGGVEGLIEEARARGLPEVLGWVAEHAALARRHDVQLVAYEAGQHFIAVRGLEHDEDVQALLFAVNRDPRMGALYQRYLEGWREQGGGLLVHFVNVGGWGAWGTWGALEYPGQDIAEAPKYLALERFARTTRPWFH